MPIVMFSEYLLETTEEHEPHIKQAIQEASWQLLGDYCLEDHVEDMRKEGVPITLYRIERRLILVEPEPDDDNEPKETCDE